MVMKKKRPGLSVGKMSRQRTKLLMKSTGGELDELIMGKIEKFKKGGKAKKKLGGGTHNTYSGNSRRRK